MTALRYPERELVSVPAKHTYYEPLKPFIAAGEQAPSLEARPRTDVLDIDDVAGKRGVDTRLAGRLTIPEEHAAAALEVMSRFAVDPRWLTYLPPTMAPTATSSVPSLLEHPAEAFDEYRREGVPSVVCEEKHMGSRAVAIVCRADDVAARRFRIEGLGCVVTRTGRAFFSDPPAQDGFLTALRDVVESAGLWDELQTDWIALDAELLPWSLKAEGLLRSQYAAVGAAATSALSATTAAVEAAGARGLDVASLVDRARERLSAATAFVDAYRPYCWPVDSIADVRVAPFQLLASEGTTHVDRPHVWQMEVAHRLGEAGPELVRPTGHVVVDVTDQRSQDEGIAWWESLVEGGGEGMVVKPAEPIVRCRRGIVQPGIKVRGPEYLRIIYGPEYREDRNLERLRKRRSGGNGRSRLGSSRSVSRRWSDSRATSLSTACMSASSACSRSRANPSIPVSSGR